MLADAFVSDIECPQRQDRDFNRAPNQVKQFIAGNDGLLRGEPVDFRNAAVLLVGTHETVDALGLCEYLLDDLLPGFDIFVPQADADFGTHQRASITHPTVSGWAVTPGRH